MRKERRVALGLLALTPGYIALGFGMFGDGRLDWGDLRAMGIGTVICSVMWFLTARARRDEEAIYEIGHQSGYDAGYREGRRVGHPTVVHFAPLRAVETTAESTL